MVYLSCRQPLLERVVPATRGDNPPSWLRRFTAQPGYEPAVSEQTADPEPKNSETDPPAANQPTDEGSGSPEPKEPDPVNAKGRAANEPSLSRNPVPEASQVSPGKPDGEVST
jgi:hypothetical protein